MNNLLEGDNPYKKCFTLADVISNHRGKKLMGGSSPLILFVGSSKVNCCCSLPNPRWSSKF